MDTVILYVDDEQPNLDLFRRSFDEEFTVIVAADGPAALEILSQREVSVLVTDQRMAPMTGIELLTQAAVRWPNMTRVLLTAYSDRDLLLDAIQRGKVHDYVLKPWVRDDLNVRLHAGADAFARKRAQADAELERDSLKEQLDAINPSAMIGLSGGLAPLGAKLNRIAPTESTVLIRGETGTGKELVAHELHRSSLRSRRPFVRVNCSAFTETLLESELFGHEPNAFTGAGNKVRIGRFEQANGGTLFLDEIGDITPAVQVRLLRVLQEREFERVGGTRTIKVDIRVLAATHRDLEAMMRAGQFRQDLFFRLNVVPVDVPSLRVRPEDIDPLARHYVAFYGRQLGKRVELSLDAIDSMRRYDWPGNVRELRNVIERTVVLADDAMVLEPGDLMFDVLSSAPTTPAEPAPTASSRSVFEEIAQAEAEKLKSALRQTGGSVSRAAKLLNLPRTTLNDRLKRLGIT